MYLHIPLESEQDVVQYLQIKGECHIVFLFFWPGYCGHYL